MYIYTHLIHMNILRKELDTKVISPPEISIVWFWDLFVLFFPILLKLFRYVCANRSSDSFLRGDIYIYIRSCKGMFISIYVLAWGYLYLYTFLRGDIYIYMHSCVGIFISIHVLARIIYIFIRSCAGIFISIYVLARGYEYLSKFLRGDIYIYISLSLSLALSRSCSVSTSLSPQERTGIDINMPAQERIRTNSCAGIFISIYVCMNL